MKNFIRVLFLLVASTSYGQNIEGVVYDEDSNTLPGASVWWAETNVGEATDLDGRFTMHRVKGYDRLVASYLGFVSDTILISNAAEQVVFRLKSDGVGIDQVVVNSSLGGNYIKQGSIGKDEVISFAGLCKMACCNLAESFENSASVTVGYSDAISGARQIKMLGLAGIYTQILDENRPIMRGIGAPYGLSYTPGMWLNSIQVSKGVSSVTAGHEAITGQINLEHRKPTDDERLFVNFYVNDELRPEINLSSAMPVSKDKKLSTVVLFHASGDTDLVKHDMSGDGFRDMPLTQQYNLANRWLYSADNGVQVRWGFKLLQESRLGGDFDYVPERRDFMLDDNIYGSEIMNRGANAYFKVGAPVGAAVYDEKEGSELRSNVAFVADFDHFDEDAYFGLNDYYGRENSLSMNLMYNHYFTATKSLIVGASAHSQQIGEWLKNDVPWSAGLTEYDLSRRENEVGLFGEYTYTPSDKFSFVAGVRGDYNAYFDRYFATPRAHMKWSVVEGSTIRLSAGLGTRSANVVTDNIGILATGRNIIFDDGVGADFDRQERALTFGGSFTQTFSIVGERDATLSFDYFRSDFAHQVIVDQEFDKDNVHVYASDNKSFTDTYQVDFSWNPVERLDIFATYRYSDSRVTLERPSGESVLVERPLVGRSKALLNLQYATPYRRWTFDVTAQLNGPMRLPTQSGDLADSSYSPTYPMFYAQVSHRYRSVDLYAGVENIANYTQDVPIIASDAPFSSAFNSSVVWGPLMGRKFYIGLRYNLY